LEVIARAAVVVGGYPHSHEPYYLSDRPFISMRSGRPVVDLRVEGVDSLLQPGREWELATGPKEVVGIVERLLDHPERAAAIGAAGCAPS
jgi:spore maturation protein CgeB